MACFRCVVACFRCVVLILLCCDSFHCVVLISLCCGLFTCVVALIDRCVKLLDVFLKILWRELYIFHIL